MAEITTEICAFPGCERPVAPGPEGAGRPVRYCELPEHNAQTAFRERRRRAAAGEIDDGEREHAGGDRPVSLAAMTLRALASRLSGDLERADGAEIASRARVRHRHLGSCLLLVGFWSCGS